MITTKKDVYVNQHGLEVSVEVRWIEKDEQGNKVEDWMIDEYNLAKMALYIDATQLLDAETEAKEIATILSIGAINYLNSKL